MSPRDPRLWIGLISCAVVVTLAVLAAARRTSPGPLAEVHARRSELADPSGCAECHGGGGTSMAEACTRCHGRIAGQIAAGEGLHGRLEDPRACAVCHGEHHGPGFELAGPPSFARAGVAGPDGFDHGWIGLELEGVHARLDCAACHPQAHAAVLPDGEPRWGGLERSCTGCHEDPHAGGMQRGCADCHGQSAPFAELADFRHHPDFPLTGAHSGLACADCHAGAHAVEAETGPDAPAWRACSDCHDSPHREPFASAVHGAGATCGTCHSADAETFAAADLEPGLHAAAGFALEEPHADLACAACHDPGRPFAERYPGRDAANCAACHTDPHGGQFTPGDCLGCHGPTAFEPHAFGVERHAATGFPLTGAHRAVTCAECHERPAPDSPRTFRGTDRRCAACHADPHGGLFDGADGCAACHDPRDFSSGAREGFDHGRTGFALRGAHAHAACETCHAASAGAPAPGRSLAPARTPMGGPVSCAECHPDPHGGAFQAPHLPGSVAGRTGCARCHGEVSFRRTHVGAFEHGVWTGFALEGAHAELACAACHSPLPGPDVLGRTFDRAPGGACADCHGDPHAGQFRVAGGTDCNRCHSTGAPFGTVSFDHGRDSRFPLDRTHAALVCAACHLPRSLPDGRSVVHYKPLGTACADCHRSDDDGGRR